MYRIMPRLAHSSLCVRGEEEGAITISANLLMLQCITRFCGTFNKVFAGALAVPPNLKAQCIPVKGDGTVKAARTQQGLVQDIRPVGSREHHNTLRGGKAIHLHQKLVQRAFPLVIAATSKTSLVP